MSSVMFLAASGAKFKLRFVGVSQVLVGDEPRQTQKADPLTVCRLKRADEISAFWYLSVTQQEVCMNGVLRVNYSVTSRLCK